MAQKVRLVYPTAEMEKDAIAFKNKFFSHGERIIHGSFLLDTDRYSYPEWVELVQRSRRAGTADPRYGVSDTLFAVNLENEIVGIITVRYDVTGFYKDCGHIGYSVAPDRRRQGYAAAMLREALAFAKEHGLTEVKVVCAADNAASRNTVLSCGGRRSRCFRNSGHGYEEFILEL